MEKAPLGRLTPVDLRSHWEREDTDFTPWLAEEDNIALLGDTIGMELEVQEQEANVGLFRADILCRNAADNSFVLIENQLERTDHSHLGQLMTYAAGLDAVTLVWVVQSFTEEHRAALDWLNRITHEGFRFFGLEVELWRIGDSAPAPKFNLVVKPNDWSKTVKEVAQVARGKLTPGQQLQLDYWTSFGEFMTARQSALKPPKPYPSNWIGYGAGRTGSGLVAVLNLKEMYVAVETNNWEHAGWFHLLHADKDDIEKELGFALEWEERPGLQKCSIKVRKDVDLQDRTAWSAYHAWMLERLEAMRHVFRPRIKDLDDANWRNGETDQ